MKVLIVYDSYFGNTQKIAEAIAEATGGSAVQVKQVTPDSLKGVELLILGAPTRGFRPSDAVKLFLKELPAGSLKGMRVAAFDTRIDVAKINKKFLTFMVKIFGYAAEPIAKGLEKAGGQLVGKPEGFIVLDREGPLMDGELARAGAWAKSLG